VIRVVMSARIVASDIMMIGKSQSYVTSS